MAFTRNNRPSISAESNDSWKASAFLNVWITKKDGKRMKVGMIPLKDSNRDQAALIELLSQGDEKVNAFKQKIELDFRVAGSEAPSAGFDL